MSTSRSARAGVSLVMGLVLLGLTAAVPLLDQGWGGDGVVLAGEDSTAGYLGHDHGICVLHGAAAWAPPVGTPQLVWSAGETDPCPREPADLADSLRIPTCQPRAPPRA